jgi:predicted ester cyclase
LIAEDDKVVGRTTVTATHQGEFTAGAATGKPVTYNEIFLFRFAAGPSG